MKVTAVISIFNWLDYVIINLYCPGILKPWKNRADSQILTQG
jgi:hypothetical protein